MWRSSRWRRRDGQCRSEGPRRHRDSKSCWKGSMVSAMEKRASSSPPVTPTLRAIPFTASGGAEALLLNSAQREQLSQIGVRIRLPARMVILREESPADWVFAISDGCVKCYRELPSGKRALSAFLFNHDIFGLAENGRYVNTVQAISNVT